MFINISYFFFLFNIIRLGKGLGKKEDGIAAPVRASLKFDHTGIGFNTANADSYGDKWWTRTYNDAANGLDVKNKVMLYKIKLLLLLFTTNNKIVSH